jgi:hypothetical protein
LIRLRKTPEDLNTKTLRADKMMLSLVWGFLPRRAFFCCTENFNFLVWETKARYGCFAGRVSVKGTLDLS